MSNEKPTTPLEAAVASEHEPEVELPFSGEPLPVVVYVATSVEDGEIVRGLLESEGIQVILTTPGSPIYGDAFGIGEGQSGEILVAAKDVEQAKAILAASSSLDQIES